MCEHGTTVPMPIKGRVCDIDSCLAHLVAALNAGGIITTACCCGHGYMPPSVILDDDRWLVIMPRSVAEKFYANYPRNIHGETHPNPARVLEDFVASGVANRLLRTAQQNAKASELLHEIETNADPAGRTRELISLRETVAALQNVQRENDELRHTARASSEDRERMAELERLLVLFDYLNTTCRREIPMRNITGGEHDGITYRWQIDHYVPKGGGERAPDLEDAIVARRECGK